jgi:hypothetical protein
MLCTTTTTYCLQGTELGGGARKGQSNEAGQDEDDDIDMKNFQNSSDRYVIGHRNQHGTACLLLCVSSAFATWCASKAHYRWPYARMRQI